LTAGGVRAFAGIWLSDNPAINYADELFQEREMCSVTANTRVHGDPFLNLAQRFAIRFTTTGYPMSDASRALMDLKHGRVTGAAVFHND